MARASPMTTTAILLRQSVVVSPSDRFSRQNRDYVKEVLTHGLLVLFLSSAVGCPPVLAQSAAIQSATARGQLTVGGDVEKRLSLTREDLLHMPRKTLKVTNPHDNKQETYQGVLLTELLKRAGVPQGAQLRAAAMATYVQADAADGYRVVFSLVELDTDFQDSDVLVADTMNGAPLD